jgi:hypothetical protein
MKDQVWSENSLSIWPVLIFLIVVVILGALFEAGWGTVCVTLDDIHLVRVEMKSIARVATDTENVTSLSSDTFGTPGTTRVEINTNITSLKFIILTLNLTNTKLSIWAIVFVCTQLYYKQTTSLARVVGKHSSSIRNRLASLPKALTMHHDDTHKQARVDTKTTVQWSILVQRQHTEQAEE